MRPRNDKALWFLIPGIALALSSVSILTPQTRADGAALSHPVAEAPALDPDGDNPATELLEHWSNPVYYRMELRQILGCTVFFIVTGAFAARKRARLRSLIRNAS